uniref:UPAR/Ly6 domain-containing protein n=1 Tax=Gopherus agassizii TaxID=38772 RepID=A0A452GG90_9SAUR
MSDGVKIQPEAGGLAGGEWGRGLSALGGAGWLRGARNGAQGATALECHSCVERGDGGCSPEKMKTILCPDNTQLCMETVAAVKWSHGQFLVGEKGCGLGRPGTNDKGVDLHGIFAFSQVHNCNSSRCNSRLDIQAMALQPMGNESARVPNGLECYSCQGNEACSPDNATVVKCYDGYQGCFHGNVTMRVGEAWAGHSEAAPSGERRGKQGVGRGSQRGLGAQCKRSRPEPLSSMGRLHGATGATVNPALSTAPPSGASGSARTARGGPLPY